MFHQCFTSVSYVFHQCFTSVLPIFHHFSPVFHQCFTSSWPVFKQCFNGLSPVFQECFKIVKKVYQSFFLHERDHSYLSIRRACFLFQTHLPSQAASNLRLCYKNINKQTKNNKMTSKHLDCGLIVISHLQDRQSSPKLKFQVKALTK